MVDPLLKRHSVDLVKVVTKETDREILTSS